MLEQCCNHWKQCRNNVATLCCTKNRRCVDTKGWAGLVPEASVFPTAISVSGLKLLSYEHFSPVTGMKARWNLGSRWYCFAIYACCIFHIISIPFNCSDTALRVTKAMIGAKVIIFVFRHVCLFCQISRQNSSTGLLCRPCHMNLRRNCSRKPGQPDQSGSCEEVLNQLLLLPFSLPSPSPSSLLKLPIEMWSEAADKFSCVRKHH